MKPRIETRDARFPASSHAEGVEPIDLYFEEDDDAESSEYVVMSQEHEMSALREYLHDLRERDRAGAIWHGSSAGHERA